MKVCLVVGLLGYYSTADSKKLEHGCRMIFAGCPFFHLGLEDSDVPIF